MSFVGKKEIIWMNSLTYRPRLKKDLWSKFRLEPKIRTSRRAESGIRAKIHSWSTIHRVFKIRESARFTAKIHNPRAFLGQIRRSENLVTPLLQGDTNLAPPPPNSSGANDIMPILVASPCARRVSMCSSAVYQQVGYLKFKVRVMALNDLVAKIYRCLHEMYTTFRTNTKVQFGCLLSTVLSSTKNQHCFVLNTSKSMEEMCRFTLLALISVGKIYYLTYRVVKLGRWPWFAVTEPSYRVV